MSLQSDVSSDSLRTKGPGVGQLDTAAAVSSVVTTELFENVNYTEEDYSEDVLPETAAEMGQGAYVNSGNIKHMIILLKYLSTHT